MTNEVKNGMPFDLMSMMHNDLGKLQAEHSELKKYQGQYERLLERLKEIWETYETSSLAHDKFVQSMLTVPDEDVSAFQVLPKMQTYKIGPDWITPFTELCKELFVQNNLDWLSEEE